MSESIVPVRTYLAVYGALLLLLAATTLMAFVDLGAGNAAVALAIAAGKGLLVLLYFMDLRRSTRVIWIYAIAGFYWLGILATLTMADLLTRS